MAMNRASDGGERARDGSGRRCGHKLGARLDSHSLEQAWQIARVVVDGSVPGPVRRVHPVSSCTLTVHIQGDCSGISSS